MANDSLTSSIKTKLTKRDAQTIAEGNQIAGDLEQRLRSKSGNIYHSEINLVTETGKEKGTRGMEGNSHDKNLKASTMPTVQEEKERHDSQSTCCPNNDKLIGLIENLQKTVEGIDKKFTDHVAAQVKTDQRVDKIEEQQEIDRNEMKELSLSIQQYQVKVDILSDIVVKQHQQLEDLKQQVTETQVRTMKCNLIITGIPYRPNESCVRAVNDFIVQKLQITDKLIPIESAFCYGGKGKNRPMVVILRHAEDKAAIFEKVGNLKGEKSDGIQCFVANQLPEAANENRRQVNQKLSENKKKPRANQLDLTVKQGKLMYKSKPLERKVWPPTPGEMLRLHDHEIERINDIKIEKGLLEEEQGSTFMGYTLSVKTHQEINEAYQKMKLMHGQATHIACAYSISTVPSPYNEGACDDGEYGAGRLLLGII